MRPQKTSHSRHSKSPTGCEHDCGFVAMRSLSVASLTLAYLEAVQAVAVTLTECAACCHRGSCMLTSLTGTQKHRNLCFHYSGGFLGIIAVRLLRRSSGLCIAKAKESQLTRHCRHRRRVCRSTVGNIERASQQITASIQHCF